MHHSYEGLDRAGGVSRVRMLTPLRQRDFRLLWSGMCVSLLGDGVFMVALAWQAYALSDAPSALAVVSIAMTIPTIVCLLIGGAVSDRVDRRRVMLAADAVRAVVLAVLTTLAACGALALWHLLVLAAVYGAATAFFDPAFDAIVPEVLAADALPQANALDQLIRPVALRLAGPALGGFIIAAGGTAGAFGLDALSFVASAVAVSAMSRRSRPGVASAGEAVGVSRKAGRAGGPSAAGSGETGLGGTGSGAACPMGSLGEAGSGEAGSVGAEVAAGEAGSVGAEIAAGMRYVSSHPWLWVTFASAAVAYLLFMGPTEVLLPFVVKNHLRGGAGDLGLVYAAGGLGSLLCALVMGQVGLPRRAITFMYVCWTVATLAVAGYGLSHALWVLMATSVVFNTLETAGTIAWGTAKQRHVPLELLGRVSSLDWLISIGLLPVSFALTGPVSSALGVRTTMVAAGLLGGAVTLAALFVPGVRDLDRDVGEISVTPEELAEGSDQLGTWSGVEPAAR